MDTRVLEVKQFEGYEVRIEEVIMEGNDPIVIQSAYTSENYYIGDPDMADRLITHRGIKPEPRQPADPEANDGRGRTCTIGFCERDEKWYGWSHRAICGFGIGDRITSKEYACSGSLPVGFEAKTLDDAKRMAVAFAEAVG